MFDDFCYIYDGQPFYYADCVALARLWQLVFWLTPPPFKAFYMVFLEKGLVLPSRPESVPLLGPRLPRAVQARWRAIDSAIGNAPEPSLATGMARLVAKTNVCRRIFLTMRWSLTPAACAGVRAMRSPRRASRRAA